MGTVVTTPPNGSMSTSTRFASGAQTRISLSVMRSHEESYRKKIQYAAERHLPVAVHGPPRQPVGPAAGRHGKLLVAPAVERRREPGHHGDDLVTGRIPAGDREGVFSVRPHGTHGRRRADEPLWVVTPKPQRAARDEQLLLLVRLVGLRPAGAQLRLADCLDGVSV